MKLKAQLKRKFTFVYPDFEYAVTKKGVDIIPGGWYSEGIAQLTAVIEEQSWEVSLIHPTKPISKKEFLDSLKKHNPDIIGFSVRTGVYRKAKEMLKWASELGKFIIVGSYHPTLWPKEVISWQGVNAVCIGEGENAIKDLLKCFNHNKNPNMKLKSFMFILINNFHW